MNYIDSELVSYTLPSQIYLVRRYYNLAATFVLNEYTARSATTPVVSAPEESLLLQAPTMSQGQPWVGPSSGGEPAGSRLAVAPLTTRPATASHHDGELDAVREPVNIPDLSREGLFDIHQGHPHSGASPELRQDTQGCPFRMTSFDVENGGSDF